MRKHGREHAHRKTVEHHIGRSSTNSQGREHVGIDSRMDELKDTAASHRVAPALVTFAVNSHTVGSKVVLQSQSLGEKPSLVFHRGTASEGSGHIASKLRVRRATSRRGGTQGGSGNREHRRRRASGWGTK